MAILSHYLRRLNSGQVAGKNGSRRLGTIDERNEDDVISGETKHTVIWGEDVESDDFVKVPRALIRLGRYDKRAGKGAIQPRHIVLLLTLASRRFRDRPLRTTWTQLGQDIGVRPDTVRKWAYELRKANLLHIVSGRDRADGDRRNEFDLTPFVEAIRAAYSKRFEERIQRGYLDAEESSG